jgi:intracellular multiplication protein IcmQ
MKDQLTDAQNEAILKALEEAINQGPWDKSHFLKVIGKNLNEIRDGLRAQMNVTNATQIKADAHSARKMALRGELQEVYVALYSSDGSNIQSWEKMIANLPRQMTSRAIYAVEEYVQTVIKAKENKNNEAYVAIYINEFDILQLPPDKAAVDKFGHPLLALKDKILNLENISRFVHQSGVYQFERNRLIKT